MFGSQDVSTINPTDLLLWRNTLHTRGLAQRTVNNRTKKLKHFFRWCLGNQLITVNPAAGLTIREPRRTIRDKAAPEWLLTRMMEIAADQADPLKAARDRALLGMMIEYGARRGDVVSARLSRMSDREFVLVVKGGHESSKTITSGYRPILQAYLERRAELYLRHDYLFVSTRRPYAPLKAKSVTPLINNLSDRAGCRISPHAIRHWFGQTCADQRIPPTVTQMLMDHANVRTTLEEYYNQDRTRMDSALEAKSILKQQQRRVIQFPSQADKKAGEVPG